MSGRKPNQVKKEVKKAVKRAVAQRPRKTRRLPKTVSFRSRNQAITSVGMAKFLRAPQARDYVAALRDPFFAPAPKLGFGTFVPTAKHAMWRELPSSITQSTSGSFAVMWNCTPNGFIFYESVTSGTLLSVSTAVTYGLTNANVIANMCQSARIINAAMRVKVRGPATSLPGTCGAIFIPEENRQNIESLSFSALQALPSYRPFTASSVGQIGGEVQYRPADVTDFEFVAPFASSSQASATIALPSLVVVGTGWSPANFQVEVTVIAHIEALGGVDSAGETDSEPDLRQGGATIDSVATQIMQAGEPVRTSLEALMALDAAHSNIQRARNTRSLSGMIENFASGMQSNSVLHPLAAVDDYIHTHDPSTSSMPPTPTTAPASMFRSLTRR